jgi:hypothetical protein
MTELHWGESKISLDGCSADRPYHQNKTTKPEENPLFNITNIPDQPHNSIYYFTVVPFSGHHQIQSAEKGRLKYPCSTPTGHIQFVPLQTGFKCTSATFQSLMNSVTTLIKHLITKRRLLYLKTHFIRSNKFFPSLNVNWRRRVYCTDDLIIMGD